MGTMIKDMTDKEVSKLLVLTSRNLQQLRQLRQAPQTKQEKEPLKGLIAGLESRIESDLNGIDDRLRKEVNGNRRASEGVTVERR